MADDLNKIFLDAIPSIQDDRDYRYSQSKTDLRKAVDLRQWDSPVESQGSLGSCVGNAIANAYELMVRRLYPDKFVDLSRLFLYYNSRLFDNSVKEDRGVYIRDGLKSASRYGMCSETLWPYDVTKYKDQPTPESYVDATQRLITRYETLYTLRDLLEILNDSRPVVIGMSVYPGFMEMNRYQSVVMLPRASDNSIGAHAVMVLGYDLAKQMFLAKNSFGKDWGDNGYFWIPFEYMRTQVFEKWCFDISSQNTIDIDAPIELPVLPPSIPQMVVETGSNGYTVKQISPEQSRILYRT